MCTIRPVVDKTHTCRLLILGDGPGARCWVMNFSQCIDPMLLQEIFQTLSNNNNKEKKNLPAGGTQETHTLLKQVLVKYLNVWFQ